MTRLKWLWWKFWAWLTTPWRPKDVMPNPRSKKPRGDPAWYRICLYLMYAVNITTGYMIVLLLAWIALR